MLELKLLPKALLCVCLSVSLQDVPAVPVKTFAQEPRERQEPKKHENYDNHTEYENHKTNEKHESYEDHWTIGA